MKTKLLLNHAPLCLPNLKVLEISSPVLNDAFCRAAQILRHQLEQLHATTATFTDFRPAPWNWVLLGLLSQTSSHYHTYVYLELHHNRTGSLFLERLQETAITLIYLLEEADTTLLSKYLATSVSPARELLRQVTAQLRQWPQQAELLRLKAQLETFINRYQELTAADDRQMAPATTSNWGPSGAETTAQRAAQLGLPFLANPVRQLALTVRPASGLELQLQSLLDASDRAQWNTVNEVNFTELRDAAHLCLHVAQTWLTEVSSYLEMSVAARERQQRCLTRLYEWFHQAHIISQQLGHNNSFHSSFTQRLN